MNINIIQHTKIKNNTYDTRYKTCICQYAHTHSATAARLDLCDMLQIYMFELLHNTQANTRKQAGRVAGQVESAAVDAKVEGAAVDAKVEGVV